MEEYPLVAYLVSHLVAVAEHFKNPPGNQPCFKVIGENLSSQESNVILINSCLILPDVAWLISQMASSFQVQQKKQKHQAVLLQFYD